jgi:predicted lipoprotein with Yx(FWY)xxD motif
MRTTVIKALAALSLALLLAGFAWAQSQDSILAKSLPDGSSILTDGKGMTLYYFTKDAKGESSSSGQVAKAWPAFYAPSISVSPPLKAEDFDSVTRDDGSRQTTYHGWPLYHWFKDKMPGDMGGEGVGKAWYVLKVPAYTVMIATDPALGNYLVDGEGNSLYYFAKDSVGASACNGDCIKNWPAFSVSSLVLPSGLNASDFGTIVRSDGSIQVTYKGYPLYYWKKDGSRGDVTGQGVGKVWYVVEPEKFMAAGTM